MNAKIFPIYLKVWSFTWPAILANISIPLLGLVDTGILGHLESSVFLSGVSIANSLFTLLFWAFGFLRMGTTGVVAREYGCANYQSVFLRLIQYCMVALLISVFLVVFGTLFFDSLVTYFNASVQVTKQAKNYFDIRIYSTPAVLINYVIVGWFIGIQKPKNVLLILLTSNILNAILDFIFVIQFDLKVFGAGLATVIADYISLLIAINMIIKLKSKFLLVPISRKLVIHFKDLKYLISQNQRLFIRTLCIIFVQMFFISQSSGLGDTFLAANTIMYSLLIFISGGLDGFAHAAEALIGEAVGKKNYIKFYQVVKVTGICSAVLAVIFSLTLLVLGDNIVRLLTDIYELQAMLQKYWFWIVLLPLFSVWCFWLDGVFIGCMRTEVMQNTTIFSLLCVFFPLWYFTQSLQNNGLWLSYLLFMLSRGVSIAFVYCKIFKKSLWNSSIIKAVK